MEVVKAGLSLGFVEALQPWLDLRSMLRWGQGNDQAEIQGQAFVSLNEPTRQRVIVQVKALSVEQETSERTAANFADAIAKVQAFPDHTFLGSLSLFRMDMQFIEPFELPFHELNTRVKEAFLLPIDLASHGTDVQVVIDEAVDESSTNHHQVGPMAASQLNTQLLAFPREGLPDPFVFIGLGRSTKGPIDFSLDWIERASSEFERWAVERSGEIAARIRG